MTFTTVNRAKRESGLSDYTLLKLVGLGEIRIRAEPGRVMQVCLEDCLRLGRERSLEWKKNPVQEVIEGSCR